MPAISIGMPVKNSSGTVACSIASVLSQEFTDWELIVIDDGSTDDTADIVREFTDPRIRLIVHADNRGLPARLNEAVHLGTGRFFARMDGDDIMYPERLRLQREFLQQHSDVDLVGGAVMVFRGDGVPLGIRGAAAAHEQICVRPWCGFPIAHPTWMGRTEWFRENPYPEEMARAQDQALLLRSFRHSRFATLGAVILGYREECLTLRRMLRGRCQATRAFLRHGSGLKLRGLAIVKQSAGTVADVLACTTGLEYIVLRHRARPARTHEVVRWLDVWADVQQTVASSNALEPVLSE